MIFGSVAFKGQLDHDGGASPMTLLPFRGKRYIQEEVNSVSLHHVKIWMRKQYLQTKGSSLAPEATMTSSVFFSPLPCLLSSIDSLPAWPLHHVTACIGVKKLARFWCLNLGLSNLQTSKKKPCSLYKCPILWHSAVAAASRPTIHCARLPSSSYSGFLWKRELRGGLFM